MPLEAWVLLALAGLGVALGILNRIRRTQKTAEADAKNIYTLW